MHYYAKKAGGAFTGNENMKKYLLCRLLMTATITNIIFQALITCLVEGGLRRLRNRVLKLFQKVRILRMIEICSLTLQRTSENIGRTIQNFFSTSLAKNISNFSFDLKRLKAKGVKCISRPKFAKVGYVQTWRLSLSLSSANTTIASSD